MRNFRYRLDPVQRLKRHAIERLEEELARLEAEIQGLTGEIEQGRQSVENMSRNLLENVRDGNYLAAALGLDRYRSYILRVEAQKQGQLQQLRRKQDQNKEELVKLYQEEKMLERLREKQLADWRRLEAREDAALMDEIGTQKFVRREREHGGVMFYLLMPLALAGLAAGVAWYTGFVTPEMVAKFPYLGAYVQSATPAVETVASATGADALTGEYLTLEDFLGDPNTPMPELLQNIADAREQLRQGAAGLNERQRELDLREQLLQQREQQLAEVVRQASDTLAEIRQYERMREERQKSELSERETALATMLSGAKPKDITPVVSRLFQGEPVDTPEEQREKQLIMLRILHRLEDRALKEVFSALSKENPQVAAQLVQAYYNTGTNELYNLTPAAPSAVTDGVLPPPQLIEESGTTPPAGQ